MSKQPLKLGDPGYVDPRVSTGAATETQFCECGAALHPSGRCENCRKPGASTAGAAQGHTPGELGGYVSEQAQGCDGHTPLPWSFRHYPGTLRHSEVFGPRHPDGGHYAALCDFSECADAELAVRAVNAYPELLATLAKAERERDAYREGCGRGIRAHEQTVKALETCIEQRQGLLAALDQLTIVAERLYELALDRLAPGDVHGRKLVIEQARVAIAKAKGETV